MPFRGQRRPADGAFGRRPYVFPSTSACSGVGNDPPFSERDDLAHLPRKRAALQSLFTVAAGRRSPRGGMGTKRNAASFIARPFAASAGSGSSALECG
ncbi:hypothetical protein MRX96_054341 [Rhipicephalus microplus]